MQVEILIKFEYTGVLRDKTIQDKLIYIPNIDKQISNFCRSKLMVKSLCTTSLELTNNSPLKVPKVFNPTNDIKLI